jgi:hypothetical protein
VQKNHGKETARFERHLDAKEAVNRIKKRATRLKDTNDLIGS